MSCDGDFDYCWYLRILIWSVSYIVCNSFYNKSLFLLSISMLLIEAVDRIFYLFCINIISPLQTTVQCKIIKQIITYLISLVETECSIGQEAISRPLYSGTPFTKVNSNVIVWFTYVGTSYTNISVRILLGHPIQIFLYFVETPHPKCNVSLSILLGHPVPMLALPAGHYYVMEPIWFILNTTG